MFGALRGTFGNICVGLALGFCLSYISFLANWQVVQITNHDQVSFRLSMKLNEEND